MAPPRDTPTSADVREAREHFPATQRVRYLNTAAVGLASTSQIAAYRDAVDRWGRDGFDITQGEAAGDAARAAVARLIGADTDDVALIPSMSGAAGLVAAQFGPATPGENVVIGEREYTSNHFPWRLLAEKGYDVRQVGFRNGGLEPEVVTAEIDAGTRLVAFSAVQSATGHRSDVAAISEAARAVGAVVFVDGTQLVGALPVAPILPHVDVLATPDHKFLMNAGRGMGYCYIAPRVRERFTPINAGWKAGRVPFESFFGPTMDLSPTASRFDNSISWLAALGNQAALSMFDRYGPETIYARNLDLAGQLRAALADVGWGGIDLPTINQSTIVSTPLGDADPDDTLASLRARHIVGAVRDGHLRLALHFYNHEDDIVAVAEALADCRR